MRPRTQKTPRRPARAPLQSSEQLYCADCALFEEAHEAIVVTQRDGTILNINKATCQLLAYQRAELIGMNIGRVYDNPADRPRFQEVVERAGFVRDFAQTFRTRDGLRIDCSVTTAVWRATDGTIAGYQDFIYDLTERKNLEQQLRALAAELSLSEERERRRLAANLHDHIGQMLVAALLKVETLQQSTGDHQALLASLHKMLNQTVHDVRTMTFDLSPPMLYELGLIPGLRWLGEQIEEQHGVTVNIAVQGDWEGLDETMRIILFRSIRELLLNVARHAETDAAMVSLSRDETQLRVVVADQGRGFSPANLGQLGFGLFSIRERITYFGGRFAIESAAGRGTRCTLTMPLSAFEPEGGSP